MPDLAKWRSRLATEVMGWEVYRNRDPIKSLEKATKRPDQCGAFCSGRGRSPGDSVVGEIQSRLDHRKRQ